MTEETCSPERLTPGNVDDRKPLPYLARRLFGKLLGDKGYLSQWLFETLFSQGVELLTPLKKNMKNRLVPLSDKWRLSPPSQHPRQSTTN